MWSSLAVLRSASQAICADSNNEAATTWASATRNRHEMAAAKGKGKWAACFACLLQGAYLLASYDGCWCAREVDGALDGHFSRSLPPTSRRI